MKRRKEGVGESEEGPRESVLSDDPPDSKYSIHCSNFDVQVQKDVKFNYSGTRLKFQKSCGMCLPMTGTLLFTKSISSKSQLRLTIVKEDKNILNFEVTKNTETCFR